MGRIQLRLALAILLTALIPVLAAIILARSMVRQSSERFFVPELEQHLERSLSVHAELAKVTKAYLRSRGDVVATDPRLLDALQAGRAGEVASALATLRSGIPEAVRFELRDPNGGVVAIEQRETPLNQARELSLSVVTPLPGELGEIEALFAVDRQQFEEFQEYGEFVDAYTKLGERRAQDERTYVLAFAALLGITILAAVGVGTLLARGVANRASALAQATQRVGAGDLSVRVMDQSSDELGELARAFNRMLHEVDSSRNRIEYLSRLASWQEMARRLAHEIKNPLTPIQLAVQEVHQRLADIPPAERQLLDTMLEIVESEVGTLRKLVGEFSSFARLPQSQPEPTPIVPFLQEMRSQGDFLGDAAALIAGTSMRDVEVQFDIPTGDWVISFDRQMIKRVLGNLVQNGAQAALSGEPPARVRVRCLVDREYCHLIVEDSGPGVPPEMRSRIFEPYVTTKSHGTGLGLSIVKKIVLEHGGLLSVNESVLGGAAMTVSLPREAGADVVPG